MRSFATLLLAAGGLFAAGVVWASCNSMSGYRSARPDFVFFRPTAAQTAAARAQAKELRRQKTLARIEGIKSVEQQARLQATEKRRDALEDQFLRAFDMSAEQREAVANELYQRGQRSERQKSLEAAKDYYLFAMQIAPGTDVSIKAHEALIRLDKQDGKLAGGSRSPSGEGLLSQADLAEIQRTLTQDEGAGDVEKVRLMLEQLTDFADEKRQALVLERLRDEPGKAYSEGLIQAIRLANGGAKETARQALADRFQRMTVPTLRNKLAASDEESRLAAVKAIAARKEREMIPDLIQALGDKNEEVIQTARRTLQSMTGQNHGPESGASTTQRFVARQRWEKWWKNQPAAQP